MVNQSRDYGELRVTLTAEYDYVWRDKGSGAKRDLAVWNAKPQLQDDLWPLGGVAYPGYEDLNGRQATLLVGPSGSANRDHPPVKRPTHFEFLWDDKGSGAKDDGSCWRPVAPNGYKACGDVWAKGYDQPDVNSLWCLRDDLVTTAQYDSYSFWDDQGTGAKRDLSLWTVKLNPMEQDGSELLPITAGMFRASNNYGIPNYTLAHVPLLKVPDNFKPISPRPPKFTQQNIPTLGETFDSVVQADVKLPFTFFLPSRNQRCVDYISDPFLSLSKTTSWQVIFVRENTSSAPQPREIKVSVGVTKSQSDQFQETVGISITESAGIDSTYVSANVNYQFSTTTTKALSQYESHERTDTFNVEPHSALVVYAKRSSFKGVRDAERRVLGQVDYTQNESYYYGEVKLDQTAGKK